MIPHVPGGSLQAFTQRTRRRIGSRNRPVKQLYHVWVEKRSFVTLGLGYGQCLITVCSISAPSLELPGLFPLFQPPVQTLQDCLYRMIRPLRLHHLKPPLHPYTRQLVQRYILPSPGWAPHVRPTQLIASFRPRLFSAGGDMGTTVIRRQPHMRMRRCRDL